MKSLYVDMDGTLNKWRDVTKLEDLYQPGFFLEAEPLQNVVKAVREIAAEEQANVYILSAVLSDSQTADQEKTQWNEKHVPEIKPEHIVYTPCGQAKTDFLPELTPDDFILDDYSANLFDWRAAGGTGIKLLNGVNGTHGTWTGAKVSYDSSPEIIKSAIYEHMGIAPVQEVVQGYKIIESQEVGDKKFVVGHNPNAPSPYVSWVGNINESGYQWGEYRNTYEAAVDNMQFRVESEMENMSYESQEASFDFEITQG